MARTTPVENMWKRPAGRVVSLAGRLRRHAAHPGGLGESRAAWPQNPFVIRSSGRRFRRTRPVEMTRFRTLISKAVTNPRGCAPEHAMSAPHELQRFSFMNPNSPAALRQAFSSCLEVENDG